MGAIAPSAKLDVETKPFVAASGVRVVVRDRNRTVFLAQGLGRYGTMLLMRGLFTPSLLGSPPALPKCLKDWADVWGNNQISATAFGILPDFLKRTDPICISRPARCFDQGGQAINGSCIRCSAAIFVGHCQTRRLVLQRHLA